MNFSIGLRYTRLVLLVLFSPFLAFQLAFAQSPLNEPKVYRLKTIDHASVVIPFSDRFKYDQFRRGKVYLVTGSVSEAMLNYSYLFNEIQFLGPKKDTLSIADLKQVKLVTIDNAVFYHDRIYGYIEEVQDFNGVHLGKKLGLVALGSDKYVGYDQYVTTSSSNTYRSFVSPTGQLSKLEKKTSMVVAQRLSFFLIDKNGKFYLANKNSILKVYSRFRKPVITYLDEHDINFGSEEDLKKFLSYCSTLN